jgi:hypothetical protein
MPRFLPFSLEDEVWSGRLKKTRSATDSGYRRYWGGRILVPAGTNYCTNPSFETDSNADGRSDGFSFSDTACTGTVTHERPAAIGESGSYSQRTAYTTVVGDTVSQPNMNTDMTNSGTFAQNDWISVSFDALGSLSNSNQLQCIIRVCNAAGSVVQSLASGGLTLSSSVKRVSWSGQATHADTSRIYVDVKSYGSFAYPEGFVDYTVDNLMVEKSPGPTPYFDGSYSAYACSWSGTAHASTSTRTSTASYASLPTSFTGAAATIGCRFTPFWAGPASGYYPYPLGIVSADNNSHFDIWQYGNTGWGAVVRFQSTTTYGNVVNTAFAANSMHTMIARLGATTIDFSLDGTSATQKAHALTGSALTKLQLGGGAPTFLSPGVFSGEFASPYLISDAEHTVLSSMLADGADSLDLALWFSRAGYIDTMIVPFEQNSAVYRVASK